VTLRCLDSSFVVDLLRGDAGATKKSQELEAAGERVGIASPAMAEVLVGAHFRGGSYLRKALELVAGLDVLPADAKVAAHAGELGAELLRRGARFSSADLLIASTARINNCVLLTRDSGFARVPGLAVETY
jgi:predicted nucleic acid-binding protein